MKLAVRTRGGRWPRFTCDRKPVYYLLEDDFELWLVNAQHVKKVPGRKTDVGDARRPVALTPDEHGIR